MAGVRRRKRLIVTGDDFGLAESINQGIIDAHRDGILTSASIAVPGEAFEDAVGRSRDNPDLGIGLHLTLTQEKPLLPAERVPSLVGPDGRMLQNAYIFVLKYFGGRIDPIDVERELRAQCEKALEAGLSLTHLDSHEHIHMWPPIFKLTLRLAKEYRVPCIRYPREVIKAQHDAAFDGGIRLVEKKVLNTLCLWSRRKLEKSPLSWVDSYVGFHQSGRLNQKTLLSILETLKPGVTELTCHPARPSEMLREKYGHWQFNHQSELEVLTSRTVKRGVEMNQIELVTYAALQRGLSGFQYKPASLS